MSSVEEIKYSSLNMISFSMVFFALQAISAIISGRYLFFYENEILLPIAMMTLAIIFYTLWDMINDPLIGHISDRNYRFTSRYGRRFPWIIGGSIPLGFILIFIFTPPNASLAGGWFTFFWFLLFMVVYDGLMSVITVNYMGLLPTKYRSKEQRAKASAITIVFYTIGLIGGFILPPLFVEYGNATSYIPMAITGAIILYISIALSLPGIREDKELIKIYFKEQGTRGTFFTELGKNIKVAFKQKNWGAYAMLNLGFRVYSAFLIASIPFFVQYIVKTDPAFEIMLYLPYILFGVIPIPLFYWAIKKYGHYHVVRYTLILYPFTSLPLFLSAGNFIMIIIGVGTLGAFTGLLNVGLIPIQGDFFDEAAVQTRQRQEGIYLGLWTFLGRFSYIIQLVSFWIIHELTGFIPGAGSQSISAQWGILILMCIFPMIFGIIGNIWFWKKWDLTPKKVEGIKAQLKELGI